jgi:hypothetical protein
MALCEANTLRVLPVGIWRAAPQNGRGRSIAAIVAVVSHHSVEPIHVDGRTHHAARS